MTDPSPPTITSYTTKCDLTAHHGMMADGADPLRAWHMLIRMAPAKQRARAVASSAAMVHGH